MVWYGSPSLSWRRSFLGLGEAPNIPSADDPIGPPPLAKPLHFRRLGQLLACSSWTPFRRPRWEVGSTSRRWRAKIMNMWADQTPTPLTAAESRRKREASETAPSRNIGTRERKSAAFWPETPAFWPKLWHVFCLLHKFIK